ncbi:hypothetical protein E5329_04125 [Petralouisia muris]|jgi:FtsZ-binding cell division protein ZapB|uniref:Uncharacterized protein n=1 Tax=Petralouisia muris TaxID=3032872 RepID=A0AC61S015_9FIRM|nr:hypothetical protein [Petralouisia muris]TGY97568.1 hypothetical protein E5329_04125 [Petralouisia muris]
MNPGDDKKYSMMSGQELKEFMAEFEEGNRRIALEFLNGEEKLFDDNYQVGEKWNPQNPGMIEDVIKLLGMTVVSFMEKNEEQEQKLSAARKKNEELERQITDLRHKLNHPFQTVGNRIKDSWNKEQ